MDRNSIIHIRRKMFGIYSSESSSFYFIGFSNKSKTSIECIHIINESVSNLNFTNFYETHQIQFNVPGNESVSYFLWLNSSRTTSKSITNGYFSFDNNIQFEFTTEKLDENEYLSEEKKFVKFSFIYYQLTSIVWIYLFIKLKRGDNFLFVSQISINLLSSSDFGYLSYITEVINEMKNIKDMIKWSYILCNVMMFICHLIVCIFIQMINEVKRYRSMKVLLLLCFHTIITFSYILMSDLIVIHPYFVVFCLYSFFIPQIIYSFQFEHKIKIRYLYLSLPRMLPIFYFTCRKSNLMFSFLYGNFNLLFFAVVFVSIPLFIVYLQNKYCGNLILLRLKFFVPYGYNKKNDEIECSICYDIIKKNEDKIVTPCLHCFHKECLEKWMNVKRICPLCRHDISTIIDQ